MQDEQQLFTALQRFIGLQSKFRQEVTTDLRDGLRQVAALQQLVLEERKQRKAVEDRVHVLEVRQWLILMTGCVALAGLGIYFLFLAH